MNDNKVLVKSAVNAKVGITLPEYRFKQEWARKGAKAMIDRQLLEDIMFEPGVEYMFTNGILYIDDMETKKELGIEPEDAKEPVNVIVMDDAQMKRYLTVVPTHDFKEKMETLSKEQRLEVAQYAISNEILPSLDKCDYFKERTGIDVMSAINLNRQNRD
jgi:hypothetical protein